MIDGTPTQDDVNRLRRELERRLDRQPFGTCSPELLRTLIAVLDLAAPAPPIELVRRLHTVR